MDLSVRMVADACSPGIALWRIDGQAASILLFGQVGVLLVLALVGRVAVESVARLFRLFDSVVLLLGRALAFPFVSGGRAVRPPSPPASSVGPEGPPSHPSALSPSAEVSPASVVPADPKKGANP